MKYMMSAVFVMSIVGLYAGCSMNGVAHWNKMRERIVGWIPATSNVLSRIESNDTDPPGEKTSEIKAANPDEGIAMLESVALAAEVFSVRAGGGGDGLFPTNAFLMRKSLPPEVAHSIEGCYSSQVVPSEGYICRYVVDPGRTNFVCTALPANGYTGGVFVIRKDKKVSPVRASK